MFHSLFEWLPKVLQLIFINPVDYQISLKNQRMPVPDSQETLEFDWQINIDRECRKGVAE